MVKQGFAPQLDAAVSHDSLVTTATALSLPSARRWEVSHELLWVNGGGRGLILDDTSSSQYFPVLLPLLSLCLPYSCPGLHIKQYSSDTGWGCVCSTESEILSDSVSWHQMLIRFLFRVFVSITLRYNCLWQTVATSYLAVAKHGDASGVQSSLFLASFISWAKWG